MLLAELMMFTRPVSLIKKNPQVILILETHYGVRNFHNTEAGGNYCRIRKLSRPVPLIYIPSTLYKRL